MFNPACIMTCFPSDENSRNDLYEYRLIWNFSGFLFWETNKIILSCNVTCYCTTVPLKVIFWPKMKQLFIFFFLNFDYFQFWFCGFLLPETIELVARTKQTLINLENRQHLDLDSTLLIRKGLRVPLPIGHSHSVINESLNFIFTKSF